jgi:hypothetical protein
LKIKWEGGGTPHPPPWGFFIPIMISIEKRIRINQTLILVFQPDFDFLLFIKLWLKIFWQILIEKPMPPHPFRCEHAIRVCVHLVNFFQSKSDRKIFGRL